MNPFLKNLPLNTSGIYVVAPDKSRCQIYVPALSDKHVKSTKSKLKQILEAQPDLEVAPLLLA